ncbi:hypothetical protein ANDROMEDA_46 [Bacillus phage Andromeda]|uniref:Uncharacterized protein n=2 Tax=Andromedavirus andromeda TaxID=1273739 RepID=M1IF58_9CAUD|nr:hypothetical protein I905_gp46 [Bacillus phage Andromeda]AGE60885.1 hypothetical protein GEMINI_46 [Bacillus phage Gemini]AGE61116.1 hypothetical protein ANDROMEDA_46 [Bacillus phage Andromeda]
MNKLSHLQEQGKYLRSISINDANSGELPICYMHYEIDKNTQKDIELITGRMENDEVFILTKEHLPFLKQLVKDLEEVTK